MFVCIFWFHLRTEIRKFRFPNRSTCTTITMFVGAKKGEFAINVYLTKQRLHFQVTLNIHSLNRMTYK